MDALNACRHRRRSTASSVRGTAYTDSAQTVTTFGAQTVSMACTAAAAPSPGAAWDVGARRNAAGFSNSSDAVRSGAAVAGWLTVGVAWRGVARAARLRRPYAGPGVARGPAGATRPPAAARAGGQGADRR